jgi:hypothetical protein
MCIFAAVALLSSLFLEGFPLDRALETEQSFKDKSKTDDEEKWEMLP